MLLREVGGRRPRFGKRVFVASNAVVVGDVTLEDDVSVWYNAVLRGDIHRIRVAARSNLQDGVIVHVEHDLFPTLIEADVTVGHGAILHGCTIGRGALIGLGALVLNGADVGAGAVVAAGAVVREGFKVPERTLVAGVPAVVKRELSDEELAASGEAVSNYLAYKSRFLADGEDLQLQQPPAERAP
jgi:carbonic anhydrase/acetyltransferase-like protein (isoleucine patch superfamily)